MIGCTTKGSYVDEARLDRGLVIVLPGMDGASYVNRLITKGLVRGGVNYAIELHDWTLAGRWTMLYNLRAEKRNRRKALDIVDRITEYQLAHPGRPVFLVGQSAGAGMAAWIAEAMGEGSDIDGIVMLASALSPQYRLEGALARSRRGIVNFHSRMDCMFLGLGTTIFGTCDGRYTSAAGRKGFEIPDGGGTEGLYEKLHQVAWSRGMFALGNLSGHVTSTAPAYIAEYVAPLIKAEKWDEQLIAEITAGRS